MKNRIRTLVLAAVFCGLVPTISAEAGSRTVPDPRFTADNLQLIEENLVVALNSAVPSIRTSAAVVLKQVKSYTPAYDYTSAVIPLMAIVKAEGRDPHERISAALALHDLRSEMGAFAIKRAAMFAADDQVKRVCTALTIAYQNEKGTSAR